MKKERKSRAFNPRYESPLQGTLSGFEHPFDREFDPSNRWVVLAHLIPWDEICGIYYKQVGRAPTGREPLNRKSRIFVTIFILCCFPGCCLYL